MLQPNFTGLCATAALATALAGATTAQDPEAGVPAAAKVVDRHGLRPPHPTAKLIELAEQARERGLQFLVDSQNHDGSWGSHDPKIANLKNFGFPLLDRGAQDGLRTACTAICAQALMETPNRTPEQDDAMQRAIDELLIAKKISFQPGGTFNTWGYGYKLDFLARYAQTEPGIERVEEIRKAAKICVDGLKKFQQHQGGWGYYADQMNDFSSMSFNTAFFVSALERARLAGLNDERAMIGDATKLVQTARFPDGSFSYYGDHKISGQMALENLASGARTAVCALALHDMQLYTKDDLKDALRIWNNGENYLEEGRKLIQPHSASQKISGYFYYFGYVYITEIALRLGDEVPQSRWDRFAWPMIHWQEEDGSWWDTPAASYGDKWGTGFALIVLNRFLAREAKR